jgi:Type I phosphodiesterase / nucleotide pyrophosphatase
LRDLHRALRDFGAVLLLGLAGIAAGQAAEPPRLVLQITVDQLRGDMLPRFRDRFGAGGFRRLMEQGVWYANAHYGTGNTFTASGHAALVTGADAAEHGMVANYWFDRASGKRMYGVFDPEHGLSPRNLGSTTIADELVAASSGRSRAFAVAGKDRSAIIPAGRRGKAYWYSDANGHFESSSWYGSALPSWVRAWNDARPGERYRGQLWMPFRPAGAAQIAPTVSNELAHPHPAVGRSFPHRLPDDANATFFEALPETPFSDEYTLSFTRELIAREKLGRGGATDYLSVSFSALDYVGHAYGPSSLEYADTLLRLDALLAAMLTYVDEQVGAGRALIVLAADHGVDEIPEARRAAGYDADRLYPDKILEHVNRSLATRFGVTENVVAAFVPPGLYLDHARIAALQLDGTAVEAALAAELRSVPGVAFALTRSDLLAGRVPQTELMRRMQRAFHPQRSGDVVIVQQQFWYLYSDPECCAAMHGSPYSYDTFVPVIFVGAGIEPATVRRAVEPASVAPTIAALLGIDPPSGSTAPVLEEIVDAR